VATGTCPTCGQKDIPLLYRKFLRDHLTDPKDPYSARCPGKAPVSLPPPRRPGPKRQRQPSYPRELRERGDVDIRVISGGGIESNRKKH
jgi:hypothetical protein